jgi:hypothetical protein
VSVGAGGTGLTVTTVDALIEQVPFVAVSTYVPAFAEVTPVSTGVKEVEVNPAGPVHE